MAEQFASTYDEQVLTVYYEDLVNNFSDRVGDIVAHVGLEPDDACQAFFSGDRSVRSDNPYELFQPVFNANTGRWKNYEQMLAPAREILEKEITAYDSKLDS